jgi:hypothetical protein
VPGDEITEIRPGYRLTVNGKTFELGSLTAFCSNTVGDGLHMTNDDDHVIVRNNFTATNAWAAASATTLGNFTAGVLTVRGDFTVNHEGGTSSSYKAFMPSGTKVVLDGDSPQTILFSYSSPTLSHLDTVEIRGASVKTTATDVTIEDALNIFSGARLNFTGDGDFDVDGTITIDGGYLQGQHDSNIVDGAVLIDNGGTLDAPDTVTFHDQVTVQNASTLSGGAAQFSSRLPDIDNIATSAYAMGQTYLTGDVVMVKSLELPDVPLTVNTDNSLTLDGHTLTHGGSFHYYCGNTANDGLRMTDPDDLLIVGGNFTAENTYNRPLCTTVGSSHRARSGSPATSRRTAAAARAATGPLSRLAPSWCSTARQARPSSSRAPAPARTASRTSRCETPSTCSSAATSTRPATWTSTGASTARPATTPPWATCACARAAPSTTTRPSSA